MALTAEDFEKVVVYHFVDEQQLYNHDGQLLKSAKSAAFEKMCEEEAIDPTACEDSDTINEIIDKAQTLVDLFAEAADFLDGRGGRRKNCSDSFHADTQVLMADGSTTAIQDIRPGQQVLAGDPTSQTTAAQPVTAVHVNTDTELTDLTVTDGSVVHTTAHHPFWTPDQQRWTDAQDLAAGTILSSINGVVAAKSVYNFTGSMTMYNLTVDHLHTYYVLAGKHTRPCA